jgi:hypothetical protein
LTGGQSCCCEVLADVVAMLRTGIPVRSTATIVVFALALHIRFVARLPRNTLVQRAALSGATNPEHPRVTSRPERLLRDTLRRDERACSAAWPRASSDASQDAAPPRPRLVVSPSPPPVPSGRHLVYAHRPRSASRQPGHAERVPAERAAGRAHARAGVLARQARVLAITGTRCARAGVHAPHAARLGRRRVHVRARAGAPQELGLRRSRGPPHR